MLFSLALFVDEEAVGYTREPCEEGRLSAEVAQVLPGAYEGLLRQVIGSHGIALCHTQQEAAHGPLMLPHQRGEGFMATRSCCLHYGLTS